MGQLVAQFHVELPGYCLVATPRVRQIPLTCTMNGFDVNVQIDVHNLRNVGQNKGDRYPTQVLEKLLVKVARNEDEAPPSVILDAEGQLGYTVQTEYFFQRIEAYAAAACEAVNRIIRFFKFELKTLFLQELPVSHQAFQNAEWRDGSGALVGKGADVVVLGRTPGLWGELGIQKLRDESAESLREALTNPREPTLHEQLLSDAQTALLEGNLRRAVLELAIVSELVVERKFLSGNSTARAYYKVRVLNYIDGLAKKRFGKSFKDDHCDHYTNIDHLLRVRNKVGHIGLTFPLHDHGQDSCGLQVTAS